MEDELDVDAILAINNAHDIDGNPVGIWDMWEALGVPNGGYSSAVDLDVIKVMICIRDKMYGPDIAAKLGMSNSHVELIQYMLCSVDWCEYGSSPRGCFPNGQENFERLLKACEDYYVHQWGVPELP